MPQVRYTGSSVYDLRDGPTWTEGDVHAVDDATAARLTGTEKFELIVGDDADSTGAPDGTAATDATDDAEADAAERGGTGDQTAPLETDPADLLDSGECPWCSDYEGDAVGRHASAAHPEQWADYKDQRA